MRLVNVHVDPVTRVLSTEALASPKRCTNKTVSFQSSSLLSSSSSTSSSRLVSCASIATPNNNTHSIRSDSCLSSEQLLLVTSCWHCYCQSCMSDLTWKKRSCVWDNRTEIKWVNWILQESNTIQSYTFSFLCYLRTFTCISHTTPPLKCVWERRDLLVEEGTFLSDTNLIVDILNITFGISS